MDIEYIGAGHLLPVHGADDLVKLADLRSDMAERGWVGAPLAGVRVDDLVWLATGSHRFEAARAEDVEIPVAIVEIDYAELVACGAVYETLNGISDTEALREYMASRDPDFAALIPDEGAEG